MLKTLTGRIMAAWALLSFIITFLLFYIPSMFTWLIPDPKGQDLFIRIARTWMRLWLTLVGCPIEVKGKEHFRKGETFIVTCNHNSLLDVPLSSPFIQGPNKTIAKSSFTRVPVFGFYYMKGAVLVDRKSERSRRESFEKMKAVLRKKMHMCIYPEGTRNRTADPLKKFHDGAFKLAVDTGHSILPAVIFNTKKAVPADSGFYFRPTRVAIHFLQPVSPQGKTVDELKDEIFRITQDYYLGGPNQKELK